jgi:hypothetical protein
VLAGVFSRKLLSRSRERVAQHFAGEPVSGQDASEFDQGKGRVR